VAHEVELDEVPVAIAAIAVVLALRCVQQPFTFVIADGLDVAATVAGQFADTHGQCLHDARSL
jgi:hypothetical protein